LKHSYFRILTILSLSFIVLFLTACDRSIPINVNFDSRGGTEVTTLTVNKGETIPIPSVTKEGYSLEGWYTSLDNGVTFDEKWSFVNSVVNNEITLYAKWTINEYTITFNSNGGTLVTSITQDFNTIVNEPANPKKEGYAFNGWYLDAELTLNYTFATMPAENILLYADWNDLEEKDITIEIYYFRYEQDYNNWGIWIWPSNPSDSGNKFEFTDEYENWMVLTINLSETNMYWSTAIGIKIIKGDWAETDISFDRFIDISEYENGDTVRVYLIENTEEIFFDSSVVDNYLFLFNSAKDYYATGNFNGWDTINAYKMVPIYLFDERVNSIRDQLTGVKYLYIIEITLPDTAAGWDVTFKINGNVITFDGNLTVRVIRTAAGDSDDRDFWAQSYESGPITNLTPLTLYIPPFTEDNIDQAGTWYDNLVAYQAGTYYLIFAEYEDYLAMGLIPAN